MINPLYTTILNSSSADAPELIDPRFFPVRLSAAQTLIQRAAFPSAYPMEYRSCIAAALERLVWGSALSSELASIDKRSTLNKDLPGSSISSSLLEGSLSVLQVTPESTVTAGPDYPVVSTGTFVANPLSGIFRGSWEISYYSASQVLIMDRQAGTQLTHSFVFPENSSDACDLGAGIQFRLLGVSSVPADLHAVIQAYSPMRVDLAGILLRLKSDPRVDDIFNEILPAYGLDSSYLTELYLGTDRLDQSLPAILTSYAASFAS